MARKRAEASRTLVMLLSLGLEDQEKYGIPDGENGPPQEGEIVDVDGRSADILVNVLKCAKDYDEEEHAEEQDRVRKFDEKVLADVEARNNPQEARKAAVARAASKPAPARRAPVAAAEEEVEEPVSPVSNMNADEAIEAISRMRSTDKLQEIVDTEQRTTVVEAAKRKLAEGGQDQAAAK